MIEETIKLLALAKARAGKTAAAAEKAAEEARAIEEQLIKLLQDAHLDHAGCKFGTVHVAKTREPDVKDWEKVYDWVRKHDAFELLHKRISSTTWRERTADKPIPGIGDFYKLRLRLVPPQPMKRSK